MSGSGLLDKVKARLMPGSGKSGKWPGPHPFGTEPRASREAYLALHREAKSAVYPEIDAVEAKLGYAVDRTWLDEVALHTQIVIKKSRLNYAHGRLVYAYLRDYAARQPAGTHVTVLETGTARGYATLCMVQALADAKVAGHAVTVDLLPHNTAIFWNCIDDHDGPRTRQTLLAAYPELLARIVFVEGATGEGLAKLGLARIGFAFLDAAHTLEDVLSEYAYVKARQRPGDVIVFDDVTPEKFDGVVQALDRITAEGAYAIERIQPSDQRGYAIAVRR